MTSRDAVFTRVRETMVELFELDADEVRLDAHLIDDLGLDSIDAIDMAARMEDLTGMRVSEEDLKSLRSVSDVVDLVCAQLAKTTGAPGTPERTA